MRKRVSRSLAAMLVALFAAPVLSAQGMPPVLVETDTVRSAEFHDQVTLVGRTEASIESRIVSEIAGRVKAINITEGVRVNSGSPLLTIDSDRLHYALASKRAEAAQAKHRADLAQTQRQRTQELYERKLISNTGLDSAQAWASITQEQYNQLEAEKQLLELNVRKSVIKAPFTGHTGRQLVDVGEWVDPGTPVFEMVDISETTVTVDLPERYYGRLAIGSKVVISRTSQSEEILTGTVTGIAPNASEETHTFPVIIDVPNAENRLGGGMLVRATLSLDDSFESLAVSKDAIVRQGNQTMVYTVIDGKATPIPVMTTSSNGNVVAVTSEALSEGMVVVVRGNERIFPGSAVNVAGAPPPAQPKPALTQQASATE